MTRPDVNAIQRAPTEIARLQNSLNHLKQTQDELHSFAREDPSDNDIKEAVSENETTMYAQHNVIEIVFL